MKVRVRILDNLNMEALWPTRGYQPGDRLRCVYECDAFMPETGEPKEKFCRIAENMFEMFNRDDRPNGQYAKSMSVGDVVQINYGDGRVFLACASLGFVEVEDPGDIANEFFPPHPDDYEAARRR